MRARTCCAPAADWMQLESKRRSCRRRHCCRFAKKTVGSLCAQGLGGCNQLLARAFAHARVGKLASGQRRRAVQTQIPLVQVLRSCCVLLYDTEPTTPDYLRGWRGGCNGHHFFGENLSHLYNRYSCRPYVSWSSRYLLMSRLVAPLARIR